MAIPIPLIIGGAQAAAQLFSAAKQKREANRLRKSEFIPPGLLEAKNIAKTQANASMYPGQDIDQANVRQNVADTFANVQRGTTSSGQLLNAASKLQSAQSRQFQNIARTGQGFRQNAMDRYRSILMSEANAQQQNQNQYEASKSALRGASTRNAYGALNSVLSGLALSQGNGGGNQNVQSYSQPQMSSFGRAKVYGGTTNLGNGMSGMGFDPNKFSSFKFNPNSFSGGYSYR